MYSQTNFVHGYAAQMHVPVSWDGGWDTGVGLPSSMQPNSRIVI